MQIVYVSIKNACFILYLTEKRVRLYMSCGVLPCEACQLLIKEKYGMFSFVQSSQ